MTVIVSIDIASTGLDENRDAIIEIAAVKFNGRRVENEFTTLINPGKILDNCSMKLSKPFTNSRVFSSRIPLNPSGV